MQRFLLGFCGGATLLALPWPAFPWPVALPVLTCVVVLLAAAWGLLRSAAFAAAAGAAIGLLWSAAAHHAALTARLDHAPSVDAVALTVRIVSDPVPAAAAPGQGPAVRFQAVVVDAGRPPADGRGGYVPEGLVVRLSWHRAPDVGLGEVWAVRAVLRSPWSYANPAGFDYERWLLGAGIHATGYIRSGALLERPQPTPVQQFRTFLRDHLGGSGLSRQGILLALLTGDAGGIAEQQWQVFRVTGTVHLMVISGLHVGLAAGFGFLIGRWAWVVWPGLALWLDGRKAGSLGGFALAAAYVMLSGAGLPALRALVMATCALALVAWGRSSALGGTLLLALAGLLLHDPLAIQRLLHELQVHQVELDLLHQQIVDGERSAAQELAHYRSLFEHAPFACIVADRDGLIIEANIAARESLGSGGEPVRGRALASCLAPASRPALVELLRRLRIGDTDATCRVTTAALRPGASPMVLTVRHHVGDTAYVMAVADPARPA